MGASVAERKPSFVTQAAMEKMAEFLGIAEKPATPAPPTSKPEEIGDIGY